MTPIFVAQSDLKNGLKLPLVKQFHYRLTLADCTVHLLIPWDRIGRRGSLCASSAKTDQNPQVLLSFGWAAKFVVKGLESFGVVWAEVYVRPSDCDMRQHDPLPLSQALS